MFQNGLSKKIKSLHSVALVQVVRPPETIFLLAIQLHGLHH
jgi:hypothetical protein